jgi:Helicase associated domain
VPDKSAEHPALSVWVASLRRQHKAGRLTAERRERLEEQGFVWDAREAAWDAMLAALRTFVAEHGHASVPREAAGLGELAVWLQRQRQLQRRGKLSAERAKQLEALGVAWEPHDLRWRERFEALRQLKESGAPWNPPKDLQLAKWLRHQKASQRQGLMPALRQAELRGLIG